MAFSKGVLTEEFRKRRRGLTLGASAPVEMQWTHPLSGARLILTKTDQKPKPVNGSYVVGWHAADDEKTLWYYKNFETREKAVAFFRAHEKTDPPTYNHFKSDPQVNDVYRWEALFREDSPTLKLKQMEDITTRLADIFNMEAPKIIYKPDRRNKVYAEAGLADNTITMRRANLAILIHEFAHLANDQFNKDVWVWHGRGFMRTYLSLMSLFPKLAGDKDPAALAKERKLDIAAERDVPVSRHLKAWLKQHHADAPPNFMPSST